MFNTPTQSDEITKKIKPIIPNTIVKINEEDEHKETSKARKSQNVVAYSPIKSQKSPTTLR